MSLTHDVQRLAQVPLFAHLEAEALRLLAFSAQTLHLNEGDVLFHENAIADGAYVVLIGAIALQGAYAKAEEATIAGPNALIGETALLIEMARPATARAQHATSVIKISRQLFLRIMQEYPACAVGIKHQLAEKLLRLTRELESLRLRALSG